MEIKSTICGVATPKGEGGIGIIRVSGPDTVSICNQIFSRSKDNFDDNFIKRYWSTSGRKKNFVHGYIFDPFEKYVIDEVLLALMEKPRSYTREDVIEIQSHSGPVIIQTIFELLLNLGAAIAEPGEFTKRAFINGRIDLTQAEAVIDIITAKNIKALQIANASITGELSDKTESIRRELLDIVAEIQAVLEFPEEVSEISDKDLWLKKLKDILITQLKPLKENYKEAKSVREGFKIGILGRPNVGKSSLLNALLKKERAIVTSIPGTTRDVIEDRMSLEGVEILLYDTAGIRQSKDTIEQIGVQKSLEVKNNCELIFFMVDALDPFNKKDLEIQKDLSEVPTIYLVNKIDLLEADKIEAICSGNKFKPCIHISALKNIGIDDVKKEIKKIAGKLMDNLSDNSIAPNLRQAILLEEAFDLITKAIVEFRSHFPEDIVVIGIEEAVVALGKIIGINVEPDILDHIFSNFCIGK